jgi:hypothetical protein
VLSPQKFFPGSQHTSWDSCNKFVTPSNDIQICGSIGVLAGQTEASYNIQFFIPHEAVVRIAVFDSRAALVKVLFFALEPATLQGYFRTPPIPWDFTDKNGKHVPAGDYRVYFQSEQFLSTSDVAVP